MARGSSASSSDAPMKKNIASASQVDDTRSLKFRTISPDVSARKSRLICVKSIPGSVVDTGTENVWQKHDKLPASVANYGSPGIDLFTKSAHEGNKRNHVKRTAPSPTRSREVQNSSITQTCFLTICKHNKSGLNEDCTCSKTNSVTKRSSNQSKLGTATLVNSPNTRWKSKSKHSIISTGRISSLSNSQVNKSKENNNHSSIISTNYSCSNNRNPIAIRTSKDTSTNINIAQINDIFSQSTNTSHSSEAATNSTVSSSYSKPLSPSYTTRSAAASKEQQYLVDSRAFSNSHKHWLDGKMSKDAHDLLELQSNESINHSKLEAGSDLPEVTAGIDNQPKRGIPDLQQNATATHTTSKITNPTMQCESSSAVLQSADDGTPEVATEEGNHSKIAFISTPDKSLLQCPQETCLHCGAEVEFILSHLVHSRRCQGSYDLDTLQQVARRQVAAQTLDTIPPVGASVEVANDESSQQEENTNDFIDVDVDTLTHGLNAREHIAASSQQEENTNDSIDMDAETLTQGLGAREHMVYSEQRDFDLDDSGTHECDDFRESYFLQDDQQRRDATDPLIIPVLNNDSDPWQLSHIKVEYKLPRKVMARKVFKPPALQPDHTGDLDLVNLVRLHSKGGVPIVMRRRKKTLQEEIEEEEMEERRRRPVITARVPPSSTKFYHRRRGGYNSASDEDNRRLCHSNVIGTAAFGRKKKRVPRLRDSLSLNEVPFSETVQRAEHSGETNPRHTIKGKPPDVWKQDLLLIQQKLQDFQKRLKVCERLTESTLQQGKGIDCDESKRGFENKASKKISGENDLYSQHDRLAERSGALRNTSQHDRLAGSLHTEQPLQEEDSARDFYEADEDWFIPEKLESHRRKRAPNEDARIDSKFGVKRKIEAPSNFNKEASDATSIGPNINTNINDSIGRTRDEVEFINSNEDLEEMPDYFDEAFMRQHFKKHSAQEQHERPPSPQTCSSPPARGRRIHIKRTECKSCGAKIKYILSHLSKSFKCQSLYDMTLLRAQSEQNKKLRQRHYERQHKSIIKERQRQYYYNKREKLKNKKRLYYLQKRDTLRERQSEYYDKTYVQQREKKRLYYILNSDRIRERHRRYNTVYRQREWNKRLQLDLQHYRREMAEKGEDPDASEQVVEMTQQIMALPTDIEGIRRAMAEAGTSFDGGGDEDLRRCKVSIDSWRRNAKAWVGGRRLLGGKEGGSRDSVWGPRQHVPDSAKRGVARVKRLGDNKVIKLTKAGDAAGLHGERGGDYDFMTAADQVIIQAVGDLELGEEIQHDIEYVAHEGGDAALVEEIHIQEEGGHLVHDAGPGGESHLLGEEVARVGEVQTEIHEEHNHVSFVQTLVEGDDFHAHELDDLGNQNHDGTVSVDLGGVSASLQRRRRKKQRRNDSR